MKYNINIALFNPNGTTGFNLLMKLWMQNYDIEGGRHIATSNAISWPRYILAKNKLT